jgi:NTE family protein
VARLEDLWDEISRPDAWGTSLPSWLPTPVLQAFNTVSALEALTIGQPNFFSPNFPNPYFSLPGSASATAFYDTSPMRATLRRLCDFDLINKGPTRISLGATNVTTGDLKYFDNRNPKTKTTIGPEHVLASGSLPPGFPATQVDGEYYWDGGCISNTPLHAVIDDPPPGHTLVFMIDLWGAAGDLPQTIDEVLWRQKQIQYASRTAHHIHTVAARLNLRSRLAQVRDKLPKAAQDDPAVQDVMDLAYDGTMDILHIQYIPTPDQISSSDAEFSRTSIARRSAQGYEEMCLAIEQAPWRTKDRPPVAAVVQRWTAGKVLARTSPMT